MTSLRARLAILLGGSILSVVALASLVAFAVVGFPDPDGWFNAVGRQVASASREAVAQPGTATTGNGRFALLGAPVFRAGRRAEHRGIRQALVRIGRRSPIVAPRVRTSR